MVFASQRSHTRITAWQGEHLVAGAPSTISIVWPAAMSRNVCVVRLVGHETVSSATRFASSRPMVSTRLLPPKLELLPIVRWIDRARPSAVFRSTRILAPSAARLVLVPLSFTFSHLRP